MKENVILTGFMGTGKTTIGQRLAKALNWGFIDTDQEIERVTGLTVTQVFEKYGEIRFRSEETLVSKRIAALNKHVIATGGGIVLNPENMDLLRQNGTIICLTADPAVIQARIGRKKNRPLLKKDSSQVKIEQLLKEREPFYQNCEFAVDTTNLASDEVVDLIMRFLGSEVETGAGSSG